MIIKYGIKDFSRNLGFNIFIILLISLTFIACIFASSSIYQKLKYYNVFSDVIGGEGYYASVVNPNDTSLHMLYPSDLDDVKYFSDYGKYFGEVSAVYQILDYPDENRLSENARSYAYSGRLIYNYEPMMSEGKWLADVKPESSVIHAVISPNDLGLKTGDIIVQTVPTEEDWIFIRVKIVGVFRDGAKLFGITPGNGEIQDDKFRDTYKIEELFHNYYKSLYVDPILIYNYDELEQYGIVPLVRPQIMVPFKDGLADEQNHKAYMDMIEFTGENIPFADIKASSLAEVRKQLIILVPVVIGLLVLTMISVLSLTAISTHKQLKNYGVLYLCGSRWRQCAFINTVTIMVDLLFSAVVTCIAMKLLTVAGILETTIVRFSVTELLICIGVAVFVLIVSLIMPFAIIGKTQPKEILKEEE